jgi:predicted TIM-barrel enzyme
MVKNCNAIECNFLLKQKNITGDKMAKKYSRNDVINLLKDQVNSGKPIFLFGAGTGLTAKCAELGGADLLGIYSTAFWRMQGISSLMAWLPYSNANDELINSSKYILSVVKKVPCVAGIGAHDPTRSMDSFIDELLEMGFSGISNEPFVGIYGKFFANMLEEANIGFSKEVELISLANKKNVFTLAWAFDKDEALAMAKAGADVIGAMIGLTSGGLTGAKKTISLEEATEEVRKICNAVKKYRSDLMIITHGGPFESPETAEYSIKNTDAVGYASGSSGERIPTESAIVEIVKKYKAMKIK